MEQEAIEQNVTDNEPTQEIHGIVEDNEFSDELLLAVRVKVLRENAKLPTYATPQSAGFDFYSAADSVIHLQPGQRIAIPTGLAFAILPGYEVQVRPRSGLALNKGLSVINSPGTIDADFRGEICILLVNLSQEPVTINPGDRIAQGVLAAVPRAFFLEVDELDKTDRGNGGFGSTGV